MSDHQCAREPQRQRRRQLIDYCIRPADKKPPWTLPILWLPGGHGISALAAYQTFLVIFFHLVGFRLQPAPYGCLAFFFYTVVVFNFQVLPLEAYTTNSLGRNIENLRRAGYETWQLLGVMNFNLVTSQLFGFCLVNYVCTDPDIYSWQYYYENVNVLAMLLRIITSLAVSEVLFCAGHSLLHTHEALKEFHVLHHCCTHPTWSTNVLFHPVDLAIEFGGPGIGLLALHFGVFQDQATLLVTFLIFQLWYAYSHEEYLRFYHNQHHKQCDSLYVIYTNVRGNPRRNVLRRYIQGMGLQWPSSKPTETKTA